MVDCRWWEMVKDRVWIVRDGVREEKGEVVTEEDFLSLDSQAI